MSRQDQTASENSIALQAGRDLMVINADSTNDREISSAIVRSAELIDQRLEQFQEAVLFLFQENRAQSAQRLTEPKFSADIEQAKIGFISTEDDAVRSTLCELVKERLSYPASQREAMIIGNAISVAQSLTREELSVLACTLFFRYGEPLEQVELSTALSYADGHIGHLKNWLPTVASANPMPSIEYLVAMRCCESRPGVISDWNTVARKFFGAYCMRYAHLSTFRLAFDSRDDLMAQFTISSANDAERLRFFAHTAGALQQQLSSVPELNDRRPNIEALYSSLQLGEGEVADWMREHVDWAESVEKLFIHSQPQNLELTPIGKCIGLSALSQGDLSSKMHPLDWWLNRWPS